MLHEGARERFEKMLDAGEVPIGTFVGISDPALTEVLALAGFDFLIYDCEHSPMGVQETLGHVRAAEIAGVIPLARVWENSRALIQKYLDIGVAGIVVPHVESAEEAREIVAATRMAPGGTRSVCPIVHASGYSPEAWGRFYENSQRNFLVIPIIESVKGVEHVDEILAVDGIDFAFFGPGDYSVDAGVGFTDPSLAKAWLDVVAAAEKHGKRVITTTITPGMVPSQVGALVHNMDMVLIATLLGKDLAATRQTYRAAAPAEVGAGA